jgi:hypothetical protein
VPKAADAYSKILTRYPVMNRSDDAKARLLALHEPVPRPTKAALAQNKAEEDARKEQSMMSSVMGAFSKRPNVSPATTVGDPTLQDQEPISASRLVQEAVKASAGGKSADTALKGTITGTDAPGENQAAPRSDDPSTQAPANTGTNPQPSASGGEQNAAQNSQAAADPNELKPTASGGAADVAPDPNELKPNVAPDTPAPAPTQVNEVGQNANDPNAQTGAKADASGQELADDQMISSSKHKKKKGLSKIIPGGK